MPHRDWRPNQGLDARTTLQQVDWNAGLAYPDMQDGYTVSPSRYPTTITYSHTPFPFQRHANPMPIEGTITSWNVDRGFGFISPFNGGNEVFVHITAFKSRKQQPEIGQRVTFAIETTADGKKRAKDVAVIRGARQAMKTRRNSPAQWGTATLFAVPAFFVLFAVASLLWHVPGWVAWLYLGSSVVCYAIYALDKSAASANRWRVKEDTLLALGLIGGWPGAIIAQQALRHKSSKASFRLKFWVSVVANLVGFIVFCSPLRSLVLA